MDSGGLELLLGKAIMSSIDKKILWKEKRIDRQVSSFSPQISILLRNKVFCILVFQIRNIEYMIPSNYIIFTLNIEFLSTITGCTKYYKETQAFFSCLEIITI